MIIRVCRRCQEKFVPGKDAPMESDICGDCLDELEFPAKEEPPLKHKAPF